MAKFLRFKLGKFCPICSWCTTGRPDRMPHRKWRETKQQPSRARSGRQISCSCCMHSFPPFPVRHPVRSLCNAGRGWSLSGPTRIFLLHFEVTLFLGCVNLSDDSTLPGTRVEPLPHAALAATFALIRTSTLFTGGYEKQTRAKSHSKVTLRPSSLLSRMRMAE